MKAIFTSRAISPRWGGRLAAIGATAALTAAVFVLPAKAETDAKAVIKTYADIALAKYQDSLTTAQSLDKAVDALVAKPSVQTLNAAREAWKAACLAQNVAYLKESPLAPEQEKEVLVNT